MVAIVHPEAHPRGAATMRGLLEELEAAPAAVDELQRGFRFAEATPRTPNPHTERVAGPVGAWAEQHGLADTRTVAKALQRARFNVLAGYGHPGADYEGFLLTTQWCTWLFFQDDCLCDRPAATWSILDPDALAEAHTRQLAALRGTLPSGAGPLETSIHDIGRQILAWRGPDHLERFASEVADYLWGNEWEALNRARGEIPSVSAFSKMRPYAGAAYTAFQFWEIVEDFDLGHAGRSHVVTRELRLLANNCISWSNDLYSLRKELREDNPNNIVMALAREREEGIVQAMRDTVALYNREYDTFLKLSEDLPAFDLAGPRLDLRPYAERLHGWILGNLCWSRLTPRYREELTMMAC
jgi:Terpene synthase family 2, C-terminal metal binding